MDAIKKMDITRVLGIAFGVLIVIGGIYCLLTPVETYAVVGWIVAFALVVDGVAKIMVWLDNRKLGVSDTWALVGGAISVVLGLCLAYSQVAITVVDVFVAYLVGCWVLASGCVRIVRSFAMRDVERTLGTRLLGSNWDLALVMGILLVVLGICCLANPVLVMVAIGWQIGAALILGGVSLLSATI